MNNPREEYAVFECLGTPEKDFAGTAVVRAIAKAHPHRKIVVVSANPDIWLHNPRIHRVYRIGAMPYFYDDYIRDRKSLVFRMNPYETEDFTYQRKHLTEIWCDLCGVPWDGEKPEIYLTQRENEIAGNVLAKLSGGKPIFLLETSGIVPLELSRVQQKQLIRPETAQSVINDMIKKGYTVIRIQKDKETALKGSVALPFSNLREIIAAIAYSSARLFIDSGTQAGAAAVGMASNVVWIDADPKVIGYSIHTNITNDTPQSTDLNKIVTSLT